MEAETVVATAYDHLVAIVIVSVIFIGTVVAVPAALQFTNSQAVSQQQLRNTALNIFSTMLLSPGNPSNWGSTFPFVPGSLKNFGLAYSDSFSRFKLDADKVQRLDVNSPGYVNYTTARNLLNLQGYGFKLSLFRPFRVEWDIQWGSNQVQLSVNTSRTEDSAPIPNAQIKANIIATARNVNNEDSIIIVNQAVTHYSDLMGRSNVVENVNVPSGYNLDSALAVMRITVSGMETTVVAQRNAEVQEFLNVNSYGDTLTLTYRGEFFNGSYANGARRIVSILGYNMEDLMSIYDGSNDPVTSQQVNNGVGYQYWNNTFPGLDALDPALLLFVVSVPNPRRLVVVAGPFNFWETDKIFEFGPENTHGTLMTTMRRFTVISGMTYVTELLAWRESP